MLVVLWLILVFLLGVAVGSGLNVAIVRIPYEKSILWPSSHCGKCFQPVKWFDNLPLLSYWILRGKCRRCGATFSARYFFIELFTGLAFVGLFYMDIVANVYDIGLFKRRDWEILYGFVPTQAWLYWAGHALLAAFLIVTMFTDMEHMEIPLSVTITGTVVGLVLSAGFPWPWPTSVEEMRKVAQVHPGQGVPVLGWQPWPLWRTSELPAWMPAGSWQLGLATGLAGVLAGIVVLRAVRFLFGLGRGVEGLGLGDADLMMMAGAFVGWQLVLIAFFISVFPALVLGIGKIVLFRDQQLPFGPSLALGVVITLFAWPSLGPHFAPLFFDRTLMIVLGVAGAIFLLIMSFFLRLIGGRDRDNPGSSAPGEDPRP